MFQLPKSSLAIGASVPFGGVSKTTATPQSMILEDAGAADPNAVAGFAENQDRANGMAIVLAWADDPDSSFSSIDGYAAGVADADDSGDVDNEEEIQAYNDALDATFNALLSLGADEDAVDNFINNEDDAAGATIQAFVKEAVKTSTKSYDEIIAGYAVSGDVILEMAMRRAIHSNGGRHKVLVRKKRRKHTPRTSAQRAAIKVARRFSHRSAAKMKRIKSFKLGAKLGYHAKP